MKVFLICQDDWANVAYGYQESLKTLGIDAKAGTFRRHQFDYPKQADVLEARELVKLSLESDVVIWMHSQPVDIPVGPFSLRKKKLLVFHGGTAYRNNPHELTEIFRDIGCKNALIQNFDLMGLQNFDDVKEYAVMPAIDTESINVESYETGDKIKVAHYPRGYEKGTHEIKEVMKKFEGLALWNLGNPDIPVSWNDNIERMRDCDIYITALPQGKVTGVGVTAMEAAALGKIVICPCIDKTRYRVEFGEEYFYTANTPNQLKDVIEMLLSKKPEELTEIKKRMRRNIVNAHSYEATGSGLMDIIDNV